MISRRGFFERLAGAVAASRVPISAVSLPASAPIVPMLIGGPYVLMRMTANTATVAYVTVPQPWTVTGIRVERI